MLQFLDPNVLEECYKFCLSLIKQKFNEIYAYFKIHVLLKLYFHSEQYPSISQHLKRGYVYAFKLLRVCALESCCSESNYIKTTYEPNFFCPALNHTYGSK